MTTLESDQTSPAGDAVAASDRLRIALPKGRMQDGVAQLLAGAGLDLRIGGRAYRPVLTGIPCDVKLLKPQNILEMLDSGSRDLGFAGADWVRELDVDVVEVLDTGLDVVRIVAAAPDDLAEAGLESLDRPIVIASEYQRLTNAWIAERGFDARFVRTFGATEVFPPEDADCIVDNTATGATLVANDLTIIDELMTSSTRLYASRAAWDDAARRARIESLAMLIQSVLEARARRMLELNVSREKLDAIVALLPCMREPTISTLHGDQGCAVKAAVPTKGLPELVPVLCAAGGTDIVISPISQIVP